MDIELIAIGDELIYGYTVNKNASFIAQRLLQAGFETVNHVVVPDKKDLVKETLKEALLRKSCIICTGGLGPTCDDFTREVISELFEVPIEYDPELYKELVLRFGECPSLADQARVPKGAMRFTNLLGTASGLCIEDAKKFPEALLIALPGVPQEMQEMLQKSVIPLLVSRYGKKNGKQKRLFIQPLHFMKLCEVELDPLLRQIQHTHPHITVGIYPAQGTLSVHLKAYAESEEEFQRVIQEPYTLLTTTFKDYFYESASGTLIEAVHALLLKSGLTLACAESCTGGALAARFISQSGASQYMRGAIVAYANLIKEELLDVLPTTLTEHGAVSQEVTEQMARNVAEKCDADLGIAVSGIFGPQGGTKEKPVGTVCATIFLKGKIMYSETLHLQGSREMICEKTIQKILAELFFILRKSVAL